MTETQRWREDTAREYEHARNHLEECLDRSLETHAIHLETHAIQAQYRDALIEMDRNQRDLLQQHKRLLKCEYFSLLRNKYLKCKYFSLLKMTSKEDRHKVEVRRYFLLTVFLAVLSTVLGIAGVYRYTVARREGYAEGVAGVLANVSPPRIRANFAASALAPCAVRVAAASPFLTVHANADVGHVASTLLGLDTTTQDWTQAHQQFVEATSRYRDSNCALLNHLPVALPGGGSDNSTSLLIELMRAHCFHQRGQWEDVVHTTHTLLQELDSRGPCVRGQPRMMALMLGATAAMEIGDRKKAKRFYQICLHNPEQKVHGFVRRVHVRLYTDLKQLLQLIEDANEQLATFQDEALAILEEALSSNMWRTMQGMGIKTGLFQSGVLLRQCKAGSRLNRHEEALMACDKSVQLRREQPAQLHQLSEALDVRAESHMRAKNYDKAVKDLQECINQCIKLQCTELQTEDFNRRLDEAKKADNRRLDEWGCPRIVAQKLVWLTELAEKFAREWGCPSIVVYVLLSVCLSVCLAVCLCLSVCLSVWLAGWQAVWLSVCLAGWLAVWLSV